MLTLLIAENGFYRIQKIFLGEVAPKKLQL